MTRKSGGARATEKRHRDRAIAEARAKLPPVDNVSAYLLARTEGDSADAILEESIAMMRAALRLAGADEAMPAYQRRDQVARLAAALGKLVDPRGMLEALAAELRDVHARILALATSREAAGNGGAA